MEEEADAPTIVCVEIDAADVEAGAEKQENTEKARLEAARNLVLRLGYDASRMTLARDTASPVPGRDDAWCTMIQFEDEIHDAVALAILGKSDAARAQMQKGSADGMVQGGVVAARGM